MAEAEADRSRAIGSSAAFNRSVLLNIGMTSRGVCCSDRCRRGKLRRDIAVKDRLADMIEAALKISPDFAADIGPAFAEGEILAEIGPGLRIDHALEQRKPVGTSGERIEGMFAEELQRRIGRMSAHPFKDVTPDHQEAG